MSKRVLIALALCVSFMVFCAPVFADLVVLFNEDLASEAGGGNFAELIAGSTVTITGDEAFSGSVSVFVTPQQSYNANIPDWSFPIRENPGDGEFRYIAFAVKSNGGTGAMVQFPDNGGWGAVTDPCVEAPAPGTRRYILGENTAGWSGICVTDDPPFEWTAVERDMFADFGEFTITGIALTPFNDGGEGDYYDAIILGTDPVTAVEPADKLTTTWGSIKR